MGYLTMSCANYKMDFSKTWQKLIKFSFLIFFKWLISDVKENPITTNTIIKYLKLNWKYLSIIDKENSNKNSEFK